MLLVLMKNAVDAAKRLAEESKKDTVALGGVTKSKKRKSSGNIKPKQKRIITPNSDRNVFKRI